MTDLVLGPLTVNQWREPHNFHLLTLERFHEALEMIERMEADYQEANEGLRRARAKIGATTEDVCIDIGYLMEERDSLKAENERLKTYLKDSLVIVAHGIELMPLSKLSQWIGVRGFQEEVGEALAKGAW